MTVLLKDTFLLFFTTTYDQGSGLNKAEGV